MSPLAALVVDWVITAFWPLIGAAGMRYYSGAPFTAAGLAIGFCTLAPWLWRQNRWKRLFSKNYAPSLAAMGLCSGTVTVIHISALAHTTAANAAIVAQAEVLYSAILTSWLLGERFTARQACAALLIVSGTGLILLNDLSTPRWRGDVMILATSWIYQLSHIAAKRLPGDIDTVTLASGRVFYAFLTILPAVAWSITHGVRWTWSPDGLAIILLQGVLMSSINFILWYRAIRNMELSRATTFMLSYPALTLLFSHVLGHENITRVQIAGLFCSFIGAAWTARLTQQAAARTGTATRSV